MKPHLPRKYWLKIHLWMGLIVGLFIAILGLSGSLLLLKKPILEWEIGSSTLYAPIHTQSTLLSPEIWRQHAIDAYPQLTKIMGVAKPNTGFIPATNAMVFGSVTDSNKLGIAFIDPVDASAKGFVIFDDLWFSKIVSLHRLLLLPPNIGSWLVFICGGVLTLSVTSGAILWWPRKKILNTLIHWRKELKGKAKWHQWHTFFAIYFTLPLIIVALSGMLLAKPDLLSTFTFFQENKRVISELHGELSLGIFGLVITFLSGCLLPLLYISGIAIWWKKNRKSPRLPTSRKTQ